MSEQTMIASQIRNFEWGHNHEDTAVKHFEKVSGSTASKCGFFIHPNDPKYGASPDAICTGPFLLKSKPQQRNLMHHWLILVVNTWFKLSYKGLVLGLDM